jgi:hypothetical protein
MRLLFVILFLIYMCSGCADYKIYNATDKPITVLFNYNTSNKEAIGLVNNGLAKSGFIFNKGIDSTYSAYHLILQPNEQFFISHLIASANLFTKSQDADCYYDLYYNTSINGKDTILFSSPNHTLNNFHRYQIIPTTAHYVFIIQ